MISEKEVKSVLNRNKVRDTWFLDDYTFNPYLGCSFNCLFCYIRGSKYGEHMERKLKVKSNAIEILEKQVAVRAKRGDYGYVVLSSATDPYLQIERKMELTRMALKIFLKYKFPVHIITRSDLIVRDLHILSEIDKVAILPTEYEKSVGRGVIVTFSFTSVSDAVSKIFEPGATLPTNRLLAMEKVVKNGFLTGVSMMPMLPFISDTESSLHEMLKMFRNTNIDYVLPSTLSLYGSHAADSKTLVLQAVRKEYPQLIKRYEHYFEKGQGLPQFYKDAFALKMEALLSDYGTRKSIEKSIG